MTLKEIILANTGYECFTTFAEDFAIAEKFGLNAIQDTFNRTFKGWSGNYKYLTEFVLILNWKIWQHYETNEPLALLYNKLWREADEWACDNLKDEEASYFFRTLD